MTPPTQSTWRIRVASDGRRVDDAEPLIPSDRTIEVVEMPVEGAPAFDACVDALMGGFHLPEDYATRLVQTVAAILERRRG